MIGLAFAGVACGSVIALLALKLWRNTVALDAALDVADAALAHNEMALGIVEDERILDEEEAQEERDWIAGQRSTLADIRRIAGRPAKQIGAAQ